MSESISNVRNTPSTTQIRPVRRPTRDEKSGDKDAEQQEPATGGDDAAKTDDEARDREDHLFDEYV